MALYIFNTPLSFRSNIREICAQAEENDAILFIEDAVYACIKENFAQPETGSMRVTFHALEADLQARGLLDKKHSDIQAISYDEFVTLTETHKHISSW